MAILIWSVVIILILAGLVGTLIPLLPGTTLILLGMVVQKWLRPETVSGTALIWIAVFWLVSILSDLGCTLLGTKLFGGSKWGMAGATGGALVGMFFSLPGMVLGSILGTVAAEKVMSKRTHGDALKSGAGAAVGFVLATFARVSCALVMIGLDAVSIWHSLPRPLPG